jgi:hypothetical protein
MYPWEITLLHYSQGKKWLTKKKIEGKNVTLKGQLLFGMPAPTRCQKLMCGSFAMLAKQHEANTSM